MLRLFVRDPDEISEEVFFWEKLELSCDEDAPADCLKVTLWGSYPQEYCEISLYEDGELLFEGFVDEQKIHIGEKEQTLIVARSFVSVLIDNEAYPKTYLKPDTELIFRRYLEPFGVESYKGQNKIYPGEFKVEKGMSCYEVLKNFSEALYKDIPKFSGKKLILEDKDKPSVLCFSNSKGLPYTNLIFSRNRHRLISTVRAKIKEGGDYRFVIKNPDAQSRRILRERYINAVPKAGFGLTVADKYMKSTRKNFEELIIYSPKRILGVVGAKASIGTQRLLDLEGFYVSSLRYTVSGNEEQTKLILKRGEGI